MGSHHPHGCRRGGGSYGGFCAQGSGFVWKLGIPFSLAVASFLPVEHLFVAFAVRVQSQKNPIDLVFGEV